MGVALGQAVWALATSLGVAAVLRASEPAFLALRLVGAAYLLYLGACALRSAFRREQESALALAGGRAWRGAPRQPLLQGLLSNLGNPKMVVFFTSLLPQFASSFGGMLLLGLVFASITLAWLTLYAFAVARAKAVLLRTPVRRALDALAGVVLVSFGLRLAAER